MDWTTPAPFTVGQVVKPAEMNLISDNLRALKGLSGEVAIDDKITASGIVLGTDGLVSDGPISGGSTMRIAGIASVAGVVSSAAISGALGITVSGRGTFRAGVVTPTHISAGGNIKMQSGMTVDGVDVGAHDNELGLPHGVSKSAGGSNPGRPMSVNFGTYTGTGGADKVINHELGVGPYMIHIQSQASSYAAGFIMYITTRLFYRKAATFGIHALKDADTSCFYVGWSGSATAADYDNGMNLSGATYHWCAIG